MGERNVPIVFQGERARMFHHLRGNMRVFIDNDIVAADSPRELIDTYKKVFEIARERRMKYNIDAKLAVRNIKILGYEIGEDDNGAPFKRIPTDQLNKFLQAKIPTTAGQMRSFLGLARVLQNFAPNLPNKLKELNKLAHAGKQFSSLFTDKHKADIEQIKKSMTEIDGLHFHDPRYPVIAATDACNEGMGGVIYQVTDEVQYRILNWFAGPFSTKSQMNWATNKKEIYAINQLLTKNREFLLSVQPFILLTDHRNLVYLTEQTDSMMRRIQINISSFEVEFKFVPGVANVLPDKMSRVFSENKDSLRSWEEEMQRYEAHSLQPDVTANHEKFGIVCDSFMLSEVRRTDKELDRRLSKISPRKLKILATFHGIFTGHHGWKQTCQLLEIHGIHWPRMEDDVKDYIRGCVVCQKTRAYADRRELLERTHPLYEQPRAIGENRNRFMPTSKINGRLPVCVCYDRHT